MLWLQYKKHKTNDITVKKHKTNDITVKKHEAI